MTSSSSSAQGGLIGWFAGNAYAANLFMVSLLMAGFVSIGIVKQQVLPTVERDIVNISVGYLGASPEEIVDGIILPIESELEGLEVVKHINATATEGLAQVEVELQDGENRDLALQDIRNAVDSLQTLPVEAEPPRTSLSVDREQVLRYGIILDAPALEQFEFANALRDRLLQLENVSTVELDGLREPEISIEIPEATMRSLGLTYGNVASQLERFSIDTPAGAIRSEGRQLLLRSDGRKDWASDFADTPIVTGPQGVVRLGDIAILRDGFRDTDRFFRIDGQPGFAVDVYQVGSEKPLDVAASVEEFFASYQQNLPQTVQIIPLFDITKDYKARIELLRDNGLLGFILVLTLLALFLEPRVAFWVALGVPVALIGALAAFPIFGVSINMLSLFAFILVLGVVVDDAIIVGESIYSRIEAGMSPGEAAAEGARRMLVPVALAVTTNIIAFTPLLFAPGDLGKFLVNIPQVATIVFVFSLLEALFILPSHLAHTKPAGQPKGVMGAFDRLSRTTSNGFVWVEDNIYRKFLQKAIHVPALTSVIFLALFMVLMGYVASGRLPIRLAPAIEGRDITASYSLSVDAPFSATQNYGEVLIEAGLRAAKRLEGAEDAIVSTLIDAGNGGSEQGRVEIVFVPSEERDFGLGQFATLWRQEIPAIADIENLTVRFRIGPGAGKSMEAELSHPDIFTLREIAEQAANALQNYPGVIDIDNGFALGKPQYEYQLSPEGELLGVTETEIGQALRSRFEGAEVRRQLRGQDEVRIRVRPPLSEIRSENALNTAVVQTTGGSTVFLSDVATPIEQRAFQEINRIDGQTTVTVAADADTDIIEPAELLSVFENQVMPPLLAAYPNLSWQFGGQAQDDREAVATLQIAALAALFAIFAILAITFRSVKISLIVMATIPFSASAAFFGHMLLGYALNFLSFFGIIALAGLVINGSLVLVLRFRENQEKGLPFEQALMDAAVRRFRPITLTAMTTTAGLAPLLFETSLQAQFLIPMAISLSFGALFSIFVVLIFIPSVIMLTAGKKERQAGGEHQEQPLPA